MSPPKFHVDHHDEVPRWEMIKGPCPSPLKIKKESHVIHKPSFSSSPSSVSDCIATTMYRQQQRQPVIIYTHSPKIIHTEARDFMALVQKLTGQTGSNDDDDQAATLPKAQKSEKSLCAKGNDHNKVMKPVGHDDNESSSALTDENCGDIKSSSSSFSPILDQNNPYFADIPLFTPNSTNFFCSPGPVYRYPDSAFVSPNIGNLMSPSVIEFIKGLPDH
ncbi:hypothetical protein ACB098_08G015300 [Castanea mollissima]|uniref:VQ domain-containing protein n=1 Tax=Castanea mollissima TaxID=60419 RepID=A0A8J4VXN6_9ROSI|nr:hypothetical protein CMV_000464 [Castanea mollissima]